MTRPWIGITCALSAERCNDLAPQNPFYHVYTSYCEAIRAAGGRPILLPPVSSDDAEAEELVDGLDGLFFTGGGLSTASKSAPLLKLMDQQPIRSAAEVALVLACRKKKLPVIGSCRGHQMICESLGGRLSDRTLEGHSQKYPFYEPCHRITITENSKLAAIVGAEDWDVNSMHRQFVETCPDGFLANAYGPEGTVEGMEAADPDWFCITFQYHPESMTRDSRAIAMMTRFVEEAKKQQNKRKG